MSIRVQEQQQGLKFIPQTFFLFVSLRQEACSQRTSSQKGWTFISKPTWTPQGWCLEGVMQCPEPLLHEGTHSPNAQECYLLIAHSWVSPRICLQPKRSWDTLPPPQGQPTPSDWWKRGWKGSLSGTSLKVYPNFTVPHLLSLGLCCNWIAAQLLPLLNSAPSLSSKSTPSKTTCMLICLSVSDKQTPHPALIHPTNSHDLGPTIFL